MRPAMLLSLAIVVFVNGTAANATPTAHLTISMGGASGGGASAISRASFSVESPSGSSPATSPCILIQGATQTSSPLCLFENDESDGAQITSLSLDETNVAFGSTGSCAVLAASPLSKCSVLALPLGGFQFTFFGGSIPFHTDFTLDFAAFPPNQTFTATDTISTAPEPDTLVLLIGGLGAFLTFRSWQKRNVRSARPGWLQRVGSPPLVVSANSSRSCSAFKFPHSGHWPRKGPP